MNHNDQNCSSQEKLRYLQLQNQSQQQQHQYPIYSQNVRQQPQHQMSNKLNTNNMQRLPIQQQYSSNSQFAAHSQQQSMNVGQTKVPASFNSNPKYIQQNSTNLNSSNQMQSGNYYPSIPPFQSIQNLSHSQHQLFSTIGNNLTSNNSSDLTGNKALNLSEEKRLPRPIGAERKSIPDANNELLTNLNQWSINDQDDWLSTQQTNPIQTNLNTMGSINSSNASHLTNYDNNLLNGLPTSILSNLSDSNDDYWLNLTNTSNTSNSTDSANSGKQLPGWQSYWVPKK